MLAKLRPGGRVSGLACLGIAAGPNQPFFSQIIYSGSSLPLSYARFIKNYTVDFLTDTHKTLLSRH